MNQRVAIVGVGYYGFKPITPEVSYREMIYEAAAKAYQDANVSHRDIDGVVTVAEDLTEGTSIFDEYTPDQLGAVLKPVHTIGGDGIQGLAAAHMMIRTGAMDLVVVEGHSKASNMANPHHIQHYALDPVYNRALGEHPHFIAGLEMTRYLYETDTPVEQCALVVEKNKRNALSNSYAAYGARIEAQDVLVSEATFFPLRRLDVSQPADGAIVMVLASDETARRLEVKPVWIEGLGWCTDTPALESRDWGQAVYAYLAARMAYRMADIRSPRRQIDFVEIDDTFSYKELQHLEALNLCSPGEAGQLLEQGETEPGGALPVNVSGGSLGVGHLHDASGLQRVLEVVLQLRGEAGRRQLKDVHVGLAQSWRGVPTATGAVAILSNLN